MSTPTVQRVSKPIVDEWPQGYGRHVIDRVDSTNAEAFRMAPSLAGPTWIMARRQEAGRGRRGRAWIDPVGNFAATLVMQTQSGPADAARLSFVAALAVHDALIRLCGPRLNISLKWPNDVLLNGGKLSGILLESSGSGGRVNALAIGIGINLISTPPQDAVEKGALRPVSLQDEAGVVLTPDDVLPAVAQGFDHWFRQDRDYGFAPIREAWTARAARLGETVTARTGTSETTGRFEGMDETGALVLMTSRGRVAIPAADIYFGEG